MTHCQCPCEGWLILFISLCVYLKAATVFQLLDFSQRLFKKLIMEYQYQAGFMPPMLAPFIASYDSQFNIEDLSRDTSPNPENYNSNSSSGEKAPVDEEERKRIRRERNKQAAARCRQRRIEYTNKLARETEELELGNAESRNTLLELMQQKAHLEATLKMYTKKCAYV